LDKESIILSWITTIDEAAATGKLQEIYQELREERGKVANIMKVHSLNPQAMKAHLDLYVTLMFGKSGLSRQERELIAVAVSVANGCEYCVHHHAEALNQYWRDDHKIRKFLKDPESIEIPERARRMFHYAVKLTRNPDGISRVDLDALHQAGLTDENILNLNLIASYFNFVNRIALGLGVEFTPEEVKGYKA
jgi:uncharacterized peroxidase-related enzyme